MATPNCGTVTARSLQRILNSHRYVVFSVGNAVSAFRHAIAWNYVELTLDYYAPSSWTHCWNDVWNGVMCVLAEANDQVGNDKFVDRFLEISGKSPYENINFWSQVAETVTKWENGTTPSITAGGYAFLSQWGSARYNTATQFLALVYDKHNYGEAGEFSNWAKSQMDYLLGDNPNDTCYVVGLEDYSVKYPHHRAASGLSRCEDTSEQKHVLYGALVGGPGANDEHTDTTADYIYNEVTIDYNAAFVGGFCRTLRHVW